MQLSAIAALIREASPYPLKSIVEDMDGVIAVLSTQTPDGQEALSSMYWSRLQLASATDPEFMVTSMAEGASQGLERYIASFQPPTWDQIQWGP